MILSVTITKLSICTSMVFLVVLRRTYACVLSRGTKIIFVHMHAFFSSTKRNNEILAEDQNLLLDFRFPEL